MKLAYLYLALLFYLNFVTQVNGSEKTDQGCTKGPCTKCNDTESSTPWCLRTGYKQEISCQVIGHNNTNDQTFRYEACEPVSIEIYSSSSRDFFFFQATVVITLFISSFYMIHRKRVLTQKQKERLGS
eukprot:TRINITY_DN5820_c0_g1_i1.p1 TRINITY_DN5820_c0_g1~~TRINITY_DN5820_c0_g1_i1.p1  ORF type:complete len:138 (+),score=23.39 TRINITY_DN5820_c0_g1_i1:31-414(+)